MDKPLNAQIAEIIAVCGTPDTLEAKSVHAWLVKEVSDTEFDIKLVKELEDSFDYRAALADPVRRKNDSPFPFPKRSQYHLWANLLEKFSELRGDPIEVPNTLPAWRMLQGEGEEIHDAPAKPSRAMCVLIILAGLLCVTAVPAIPMLIWPDHPGAELFAFMWCAGIALYAAVGIALGYTGLMGRRFDAEWGACVAHSMSAASCCVLVVALYWLVMRGWDEVNPSNLQWLAISLSAGHFLALKVSEGREWRRMFRPQKPPYRCDAETWVTRTAVAGFIIVLLASFIVAAKMTLMAPPDGNGGSVLEQIEAEEESDEEF